ncbi:hypothetical protein AB0M79_09685 [Polymorphospora sp. NPDC051019]|uniref:hypothetical protein n=1 Tax=Polymorphospora sp. NPDC051019 TaxID=3155725 RepID=UPI00342BC58B
MKATDPARFTDMVITATGEDIAVFTEIARQAGVLVYRSAPRPAGPGDHRQRVQFRLHMHHR